MKTLNGTLSTHLAQQTKTLAFLFKFIREDGEEFGFTSHDVDLVFDGLTYEADSGYVSNSDINANNQLSVDDAEVVGVFDSNMISERDLRNGVWDNAEVYTYLVNYEDVSQYVILGRGRVGNITPKRNTFVSEVRRMMQAFSRDVLNYYSPNCRADFADSNGANKCKLTHEDYTYLVKADTVISNSVFTIELYRGFDAWVDGNLINLSFENNNLQGFSAGSFSVVTTHDVGGPQDGTYFITASGDANIYTDFGHIGAIARLTDTADGKGEFEFSYYVADKDAVTGNQGWIRFYDADGDQVGEGALSLSSTTEDAWVQRTVTGTLPADAVAYRLWIKGFSSFDLLNAKFRYMVDDIDSATRYCNPQPFTITNHTFDTGDLTGWSVSSGSFDFWSSYFQFSIPSQYSIRSANGGTSISELISGSYYDLQTLIPSANISAGTCNLYFGFQQAQVTSDREGGMDIVFYDSSYVELSSISIAYAGLESVNKWFNRNGSGSIPTNARYFKIKLTGEYHTFFNSVYVSADWLITTATIGTVADASELTTVDNFKYGSVAFTDGDNVGDTIEVVKYDSSTATVSLFLPPNYDVASGDKLEITKGCDKTRTTCRDTYSNLVNFRGEPDLPLEEVTEYPDA